MKHIKKALAWVLVLCMVLSTSTAAFASEVADADMISSEAVENQTETADSEEEVTEIEDSVESMDILNESSYTKTEEGSSDVLAEDNNVVLLMDDSEVSTVADVTMSAVTKEKSVPLNTDSLYKIFHLDCGRKYFSADQIKAIIDVMATNDYNALELAVGNDGLRFLLDDMSLTVDGKEYNSDEIKLAIQSGNKKYCDNGINELTQTEMDSIISYANNKGISVIPLINSPGHMDAILTAASKVTGTDCSYNSSSRTIDVTNATAVNFTLALVNKYIEYFAGKGCTIFNMGCDEYANDIYSSGSMGFGNLVSSGKYSCFIDYVNNMAAQVQNAGMTAMAFNDGFYFNGNTSSGTFDTDIAIAFWSSGWSGYTSMSAANLAAKGHKIINTNGDWYYILKTSDINSVKTNITNTPYNSVMGSGTMDVSGCMLCFWCDTPSMSYDDTEVANLTAQISTFASVNSSVFTLSQEEETKVTKTDTIKVVVGGTATKTIDGANYAGIYTTEDPSIATVEVTGNDAVSIQYVEASVTCNTLISSNSNNWTAVSGYYYKADDGNYYPLYAKRSRNWSWDNGIVYTYTYTWGYSSTSSTSSVQEIKTQSTTNTSDAPEIKVYTKSNDEEIPASTTITVTAVGEAGTVTYVNIGDTRYKIEIIEEDLSLVDDLVIEYWITNGRPSDSKGNKQYNIDAEVGDVNSEEGIIVNSVLPENTTKDSRTLQYWRCRLLDKSLNNTSTSGTQAQTEDAGDDETYNGEEFAKVRYWNGRWSVYTENKEWIEVTSNYQLVAYYLEILPVSDELIVTAADWGKKGDGTTSGDYLDPSASCTVSVQVVYEDGTTNPVSTAAADLKGCTIAYGYWASGRGVGTLNLTGLEGYQIWKVEAETGSETYASSSSTWGSYTVSSFTWDNNPMTVYEGDPVDSYVIHNDANNPSTDGYYANLMWDENYEAILIKVYVKAKPTDDTLKVIYYDEKFGDELYSYNINVENGVSFGNIEPTPSAFEDNSDRINVTGCGIKNTLGITQYFQTDLTKVPEAVGKYNSDLYKYTGSVISEDGKTLYLYYSIDTNVLSPMFVIDYGRPFTFNLSQVVSQDATVKSVTVKETTRYGSLTYDANKKEFTYTPTQVLPNIDVLTINITFDGSESATTTNAGVMPATTVNYEEGFASLNGFSGGGKDTTYQTAQIAGKSSDVYGYDMQVAGESNSAAIASAKGSVAEFSFTGTGVDLYVNSTEESGNIAIQIRDSDGSLVKVISVKTTSYSTITGDFSNTDQYGLIAASVKELTYGDYTVKVTTTSDATVYFDGFRVYGTLEDQNNDYYVEDSEDDPLFYELRDHVLTAMDVDNTMSSAEVYAQLREKTEDQLTGVVLNDGNVTYSGQDLLDNGPKNELFLLPGQSVVFSLTTNREVQVGMRAVNGSAVVTGTYNGTISTDKDMFYTMVSASNEASNKISKKEITICNGSSTSILSITKVKVCDDPNAAFAELGEDDFNDALIALGIIEAPSEPEVSYADAILNITLNDENDKVLAATALTSNGVVGETATFNAADIEVAVAGLVPEGYELTDASYSDVDVAYGDADEVVFKASVKETENETEEETESAEEPEQPSNIWDKIVTSIKDFFKGLFGK